jgi:hypothetical protein
MAHDYDAGCDPKRLWQSQPREEVDMTLDAFFRTTVGDWERRIARRNLREYAAAIVVVLSFGAVAVFDHNTGVRVGSLLVMAAAFYVVRHLRRHGSTRQMPADFGTADCLSFHRAELIRQRDLLSNVWWWYLLPFVPGVALIVIARALERPERRLISLGVSAAMVAFFTFVWWMNHRVGQRIQRKIDALDGAR